jgi:uncharacterized protein YukJ
MQKLDKNYCSPIDQQLAEFDATHPKSASQEAEIAKHMRIQALRDGKPIPPTKTPPHDELWD